MDGKLNKNIKFNKSDTFRNNNDDEDQHKKLEQIRYFI